MNQEVLKFCNKYLEKLNNDKIIEAEKETYDVRTDFIDRISFYVSERSGGMFSRSIERIELDEDDLIYLYEKYSKKLKDEMESNINSIKELYNSRS